jgi:hypothetical protein
MTKEEILEGLRAGKKLRCDRRTDLLLPWLLSLEEVSSRFVEVDDQSSFIEFYIESVDNN